MNWIEITTYATLLIMVIVLLAMVGFKNIRIMQLQGNLKEANAKVSGLLALERSLHKRIYYLESKYPDEVEQETQKMLKAFLYSRYGDKIKSMENKMLKRTAKMSVDYRDTIRAEFYRSLPQRLSKSIQEDLDKLKDCKLNEKEKRVVMVASYHPLNKPTA